MPRRWRRGGFKDTILILFRITLFSLV